MQPIDFFRSRIDAMINLNDPLAVLRMKRTASRLNGEFENSPSPRVGLTHIARRRTPAPARHGGARGGRTGRCRYCEVFRDYARCRRSCASLLLGVAFHGEAFVRDGRFQNPSFEAAEHPDGGPGCQSRAFHQGLFGRNFPGRAAVDIGGSAAAQHRDQRAANSSSVQTHYAGEVPAADVC